jgi:hypothetical protein
MLHSKLFMLAASFVTFLFTTLFLISLNESYASPVEEPNTSMNTVTGNSSLSNISTLSLDMTSNGTQTSSPFGTRAGLLQVKYTGLIRSDISPDVVDQLGLNDTYPGVMVTEVIPGSPAEAAGIRGANMTRAVNGEIVRLGGDIIVAVDGNASIAKEDDAFLDYLQNEKSVGDNITLTFLRDGQVNETDLTLGPLPTFFWYLDNDEGIMIQYPSDWRVSDSTLALGDVIKFFSPEENPELGLSTAAVLVKASPADGVTLDEFVAQLMEGIPNTRMLDIRGTELSGLQAYESIFYEYGDNRTLKVKSVITLKDDIIYRINYASDTSRYDDYLPMADQMVRSFKFIES